MRIAFVTPLPPQATGIADYSRDLLPALACEVEVEIYVESGYSPDLGAAVSLPVRRLAELPRELETPVVDLVVYQLGNNPQGHAETYRTLLRYPGVVVLHEFLLHHLIRDLHLTAGDFAGFEEEMRYCYGATGQAAARRFAETGCPVDPWEFPLFERVVDASLGVIVHNEFARRRILSSRPEARVAVVPMPCREGDEATLEPGERQAIRDRFGVTRDAPLFGVFGFITPAKRIEVILRAFARLRHEEPAARLLLAGEVSSHFDLNLLFSEGLGEGVEVTGRVDLEDFHRLMLTVDVALNLRYPSGGETSATLMRLLAHGRPVVVSDLGSFREIPDGCCVKVEVHGDEEAMLVAVLRRLARDEELRRHLGDNARRWVRERHRLVHTVEGYRDFLARVAADPRPPRPAVPPLAPYPGHDVATRLAAEVASALVDLGLGEEAGLEEVAATVVDLGLDRGASPGEP